VHGSEYHVSVKDSVVQSGASAIRKQRSVAYTVIMMIMTVAIYQA
jgi:hypothetical protein